MALFELPSGYYCLYPNTSNGTNTTIYGIRSNDHRTRDTIQFHNFQWVVVGSNTSTSTYTCSNQFPSDWTYLIPDHIMGHLLICAFISVALLVIGLFKVFQR